MAVERLLLTLLLTLQAVLVLALAGGRAHAQAAPDQASTTVYVRADGDDTTIVTPSLHLGAQVAEDTRVDATYMVDVWSSASVDIVTAATKRVTEQRDEIDLAVDQGFSDLSVGASYRYSIENDYESHGGSLGASMDFADKSATLSLVARGLFDQVWAVGGEDLKQPAATLSARLSFTQTIDRKMLGQLVYELGRQSGYLDSPYRYVRIADDQGVVPSTCVAPVSMCLPEANPDRRTRHAFAAQLRRAFSDGFSVGGTYRFYLDSWKVSSHTVELDAAWLPGDEWLLGAAYRLYTQSKADHYGPFFALLGLPSHYSSDKELSTMTSHRIGLEASKLWELDDHGSKLRTVLLAGPTLYQYADFPLLKSVSAVEVTLSMGVEL